MKKNKIKIFYIIIMIIVSLHNFLIIPEVFAAINPSKYIQEAKNFTKDGGNMQIDQDEVENMQVDIYSILFYAGVLISVLIIAILGIQFITSAPEGKADVKKQLVTFTVGAMVVFGSLEMWRIAVRLVQKVAE